MAANHMWQLETVPGWFLPTDASLFAWLLCEQTSRGVQAGITELGAYKGKSAVWLGLHLEPGETLTVCDLFGATTDEANVRENEDWYRGLDRLEFERNYLRFLPKLPVVVQGPTSSILKYVRPSTQRFVHVDASHLYEHVALDLRSAREMLASIGIVVCDDWRTEHAPGVGAAVWEAVITSGLVPVILTHSKLYGTWGDPGPLLNDARRWLQQNPDHGSQEEVILGHRTIRVFPAGRAWSSQLFRRAGRRVPPWVADRTLSRTGRRTDRGARTA